MEGDSFLIDLLRPELLHEVLCYLDATSLGTAAKVSKLMMPLTDEAQRRPHLVAKLGRLGAVAEELMSTLPASPSMGILFSDTSHSGDMKSRFTEAIKVLPPFTDVVGAVSPQLQVQVGGKLECASDGSTCSASLMLGRFPEAHFKTFVLTEDIMKQQPTAEVLLELAGLVEVSSGSIGKEQTDWKVFCVLVAGEGGRYAEKALSAIQGKYPKAAIVGGIAQGAFARAAGLDLQYYEDCIVGLAMAGNVPLHALVTRGARPLGPVHTVTDCEPVVGHAGSEYLLLKRCRPGDNQSENDGKLDSRNDSSVLSVFEDSYRSMDQSGMGMIYAGVKLKRRAGLVSPTGDCDTEPEGFMLQSISNGNIQGGEMVIMDPLIEAARGGSGGGSEGDESTSLEQRKARRLAAWRSAENPYEGLQLQFYQLDEKTCKSDAETQLTRAKEQLDAQGRELMGALMFSCGGRGPHEFAGHEMMDASAFHGSFPEVPMVGFYAGGEIGPEAMASASGQVATQTGHASLQGFTCVFGLFSVPTQLKRSGSFLPSTIDTSPGALTSYLTERDTPLSAMRRNRQAAAAAKSAAVPSDEDIDTCLSIKELRKLIVSAELSHTDCIEKSDLRKRAKEAAAVLLSKINGSAP